MTTNFVGWVSTLARTHGRPLALAAVQEGLSRVEAIDAVQEAFVTLLSLPQARELSLDDEGAARLMGVLVRNAARTSSWATASCSSPRSGGRRTACGRDDRASRRRCGPRRSPCSRRSPTCPPTRCSRARRSSASAAESSRCRRWSRACSWAPSRSSSTPAPWRSSVRRRPPSSPPPSPGSPRWRRSRSSARCRPGPRWPGWRSSPRACGSPSRRRPAQPTRAQVGGFAGAEGSGTARARRTSPTR
jgi:hypothetical protein